MEHVNSEISSSDEESELRNIADSPNPDRFISNYDEPSSAGPSNSVTTMVSRRPAEARTRMSAMPASAFRETQRSESESSDSASDGPVKSEKGQPEGAYDPQNFADLKVSQEISDLFLHIARYTPQRIDMEYKLKPFIPEFIPAVGDTDAFLKVVTPERTWTGELFVPTGFMQLGLEVLDEPSATQSDSALLFLQLRATEKTVKKTSTHLNVKKVFNVEKNTKAIEQWINDISDLHGSHPPPTVVYKNAMPDVDSLLQDWPPEEAEALKDGFPNYELNCSLEQYAELVCSIFDIPVYESRIESLHVLFSMCLAIKNYYLYVNTAEALEIEAKKLQAPVLDDSDNEEVVMN